MYKPNPLMYEIRSKYYKKPINRIHPIANRLIAQKLI